MFGSLPWKSDNDRIKLGQNQSDSFRCLPSKISNIYTNSCYVLCLTRTSSSSKNRCKFTHHLVKRIYCVFVFCFLLNISFILKQSVQLKFFQFLSWWRILICPSLYYIFTFCACFNALDNDSSEMRQLSFLFSLCSPSPWKLVESRPNCVR